MWDCTALPSVQLCCESGPPASHMGSAGLARLHGLFAVYKPPGLKWKHLRDTVELQLLKGEFLQPDRYFALDPFSKIKSCDLVAWAEHFPDVFCTLCYSSLFHVFRWVNKLSIVGCDKQVIVID